MATFVRLRTNGEDFALPVHQVQEIAELPRLMAVPGAKSSVLGICNLRGEILAVFDLATVLGMKAEGIRRRLAITEVDGERIGLAVDDVTAVGELPPATQKTASNLLAGAVVVDDITVNILNLFVISEALRMDASR